MSFFSNANDRDDSTKPSGRRSRGKRALILACLAGIGIIGAALLNGPGFRLALEAFLPRAAASAGLGGSASVSGTLWSGPRLTNGSFDGDGALRSIRFDEIEVTYSLPRMARHGVLAGLTAIRASGLDAILEAREGDSPVPESGEPVARDGNLSGLWEFTGLRDLPIALENLSLRWRSGEETVCELAGLDFRLVPGGNGEFALARLLAPDGKTYEDLRASLRIGASFAEINHFALREDLRIIHLRLESHPVLPAIATGSLEICGGRIALEYTPQAQWHAVLEEGAVDLAALGGLLGLDLIETGTLSALDCHLLDGEKLSGHGNAAVTGLRVRGYVLDSGRIAGSYSPSLLEVEALELVSGGNRLEATGSLAPPAADRKRASSWLEKVSGNLVLEAPDLDSLRFPFEWPLGGSLTAGLALAFTEGTLTVCEGNLAGTALAWGDSQVASITSDLSCPRPGVPLADLRIYLDPAGENAIDGRAELELAPLRYACIASATFKNLAALQPLLASNGLTTSLSGKALADWTGSGDLRAKEHRGSLAFREAAIRLGEGEAIRGHGSLAYEPAGFEASGLELSAGAFSLQGRGSLRDDVLTLSSVSLSKGETSLAQGDVTLPLDRKALKTPRTFFAQEGPLGAKVVFETLSIEELYATLAPGSVPPVGGLFSGSVTASGSLVDLTLDSSFKLSGVASSALEKVAPAEIEAALKVEANRLFLAGTLRQELMEPVTISGEAAFVPQRWIEDPASWKDDDVAIAIDLPETDLAVLLPFLPAISRLQGSVAARVRLDGPAGSPRFSGGATSSIGLLKFRSERIPTTSNADLALVFDDRVIRAERGYAEIAGGPVELGGSVSFESGLSEPFFALTLRAEQALIARDDYLNLRANAELTLDGPFSGATLAGAIAIVESRYVRDIEILPLDVFRPKTPLPKSRGQLQAVAFDPAIKVAPFDQWTLDLRITTADPFLLRGNLANASAAADLTVRGTGGAPAVDGKITMLDGEATLPFSKLKVQRGEIVFDETGGIIPRINLEGTSSIRQYEVRVRLFDSVLSPKVLLTSNPPLPQEDIATLLASGSTLDELGSRQAVASKAFQLLAQEFGRKVLRRKSSVDKKELLPEELELSFGQTDVQTGRRTASSLYRVSPNLFLIGSIDEGGDSRGLIKILLRFQ